AAEWAARRPEPVDLSANQYGLGRELFAGFRAKASGAEQGAITFAIPETTAATPMSHTEPVHDRFVFTEGDTP
ncbi:MAG: phosphogluconate dehydratase, partial [Accumulibacter sp.]